MTARDIKITYKYIDGAHFFVSDDKRAAGLCVAHVDLSIAYAEVGHQLKAIFLHNLGKEVELCPAVDFADFEAMVSDALSSKEKFDKKDFIVPANIAPWMVQAQ